MDNFSNDLPVNEVFNDDLVIDFLHQFKRIATALEVIAGLPVDEN